MIVPDAGGVGAPTLNAYRGGSVREFFYAANDRLDMRYHIPHNYAPGTDLFLHLHWSHIGTAISGSLVLEIAMTYAKGHNQAELFAEVASAITVPTPDIATVPQYRHRIDEIQVSAAAPSGAQFSSSVIEPDGLLLVSAIVTTIPTITGGAGGGAANRPVIHTLDLHYQADRIATKNRTPNFYT